MFLTNFNNRCLGPLGYVWNLGISAVLALCFQFHSYLRNFYAIRNSVNNMFYMQAGIYMHEIVM